MALLAVVLLCLITEISFILVKKNRDVTPSVGGGPGARGVPTGEAGRLWALAVSVLGAGGRAGRALAPASCGGRPAAARQQGGLWGGGAVDVRAGMAAGGRSRVAD